jgi:pimeloyl-ACP methyl ester carboxylesterase
MPSPTPKPSKSAAKSSAGKSPRTATPSATEDVSPAWLLKALAITLVAALVCGYVSVCLLFYQGQWQLVLHPSRSTPAPSTIAGSAFETIRFGVDESATPQLTGWYLPANPTPGQSPGQSPDQPQLQIPARYAAYTVLYLPSGDGSLADALPTLAAIHALGLNLFAFDYRGYGQSAATHPNQQRMTQDAASAWQYLTASRALPPGRIVLFASGVGCALAAQLAALHPEIPAVILDSPRPDILDTVLADPRTTYLPVRALLHDRFDIATAVSTLKTPKLFLLNESHAAPRLSTLLQSAATPKVAAYLKPSDRTGPAYSDQLSRFLDEYLH